MNIEQFLGWLDRKSQPFLLNTIEKPLIMGVLNVTPDSFYDGGKYALIDKACEHAFKLVAEGADLIDIGGESSKPGAEAVTEAMELARIIPVIKQIRAHSSVCISVDTYKPAVMEAAIRAGANVINDIYALQMEGALAKAAELAVPVCLMHMQGMPKTMQNNPLYAHGVMTELMGFFTERLAACSNAGIDRKKIMLDPGFGFGKQVSDNLELTKKLGDFNVFNLPIVLGVSRKSTIGALLNKDVNERLIGSIALTVYAVTQGVAIIRTHDVNETNQALNTIDALLKTG